VFRKQGFEERFKVSYQDFMYDDKVVFASIQGHENAILMDKSLVQSPEELAATQRDSETWNRLFQHHYPSHYASFRSGEPPGQGSDGTSRLFGQGNNPLHTTG
jgi:hypothetical protein